MTDPDALFSVEERKALQNALSHIADRAPVAPELEELVSTISVLRSTRQPWRRTWVMAASFAVTLIVLGAVALIANDSVSPPTGTSPLAPSETPPATSADGSAPETSAPSDTSEIPKEVVEYWSLEGTLVSVGDEPGWLCPATSSFGYESPVTDPDAIAALQYKPAGNPTESMSFEPGSDFGPVCHQPPALVLIQATADPLELEAGVAVWTDVTRFEDICPPSRCQFGGETILFEANGQPARLHSRLGSLEMWWVDSSGVPLRAQASGVDADWLIDLSSAVTVDLNANEIDLAQLPSGFTIVRQEPAPGRWERDLRWAVDVDDDMGSVQLSFAFDASFDPYAVVAGNVEGLELVAVHNTLGVWIPGHGGFLTFEIAEGIVATIEGATDLASAIMLAESLEPSPGRQSDGIDLVPGSGEVVREIHVEDSVWRAMRTEVAGGGTCVDWQLVTGETMHGSTGGCWSGTPEGPLEAGVGGVSDGSEFLVLLHGRVTPDVARIHVTDVVGETLIDEPVDGIWAVAVTTDSTPWEVEALDAEGNTLATITVEHRS